MSKRKQRKSGSISIERIYQNQVLGWQISTFLDESQELINMLELASRLSPHREAFVEMLDAAGFDTAAWDNEAGDLCERAQNEAATIKGELDGDLIDLDPQWLVVQMIRQATRLRYQEFAGYGWMTVRVRNSEIELDDGSKWKLLRQAMIDCLPKLRALVERDDMRHATNMPVSPQVDAQRF